MKRQSLIPRIYTAHLPMPVTRPAYLSPFLLVVLIVVLVWAAYEFVAYALPWMKGVMDP